ncbi:hypothetical protein [uncultured Adlercreutzia sp.]|uniref:hypothetical protein n=1 Tax=uncultured Adlercreutzia sp. TaxID=875803 RepID=UPI00272E6308|nr:hypothetical protein [uncultured Adlercreutzia sp.]
MLEEMVKAVVNKVIAQDYPYLKTSAALYAVVTKATQLGETFSYDDLVIHNDETGTSYRGHIVAHWYEYTLQVVDRWGNVDKSFPVYPDIRSRIQLKTGAFVSVALAYGDIPAIIREVKL